MIAVRPVEDRDADAWAALRRELWSDARLADLQSEVRRFFKGESPFIAAAFIAEDDGTPAGFIELNVRAYAEGCESSPVPHIEGWYVAARLRRSGVGRKLMQAAEHWAIAHGYSELTSDTTEAYPLSYPAHTANGFKEVERLIAFHKHLR